MRRVLMISPHFPPDSSAATHRVRLLAPYLEECGWQPTVVTVDPDRYEGRPDPALAALVPPSLRIVRSPAWAAATTRRFGVGDLGLRSFTGLWRTSASLLSREPFDALFITIHPVYPALLGPLLKRRFRIPYVLDYQDPWVGSWGLTVGGGVNGTADVRSRLSRAVGLWLEPIAVRGADALTAVSVRTYEDVLSRVAVRRSLPLAVIPLGWDRNDMACMRELSPANPFFDRADGLVHLVYVGTLLPNGVQVLERLLEGVRQLSIEHPRLFECLRIHFFGTSNQSSEGLPARVLPVAERIGVASIVTEVPSRIDYFQALTVLAQASGILLLGSTDAHYTASKIYPALVAERPLLALFHQESSVVDILHRAGTEPSIRLLTYDVRDGQPLMAASDAADALAALAAHPEYDASRVNLAAIEDVSARALAHRLAGVLDQVCVA